MSARAMSVSPTSMASTPAAWSSSTSARWRMPLSPTTRLAGGISRRSADRVLQIDFEGPQVAVVDADQPGPRRQHAGKIGRLVEFHQRRHAQRHDRLVQRAKLPVVEAFGDQQHGVGPGRPGLDHLVGIDDEILPQHAAVRRPRGSAAGSRGCPGNRARRSAR